MLQRVRTIGFWCVFVWLIGGLSVWGQDTDFTRAEMREFLLSAEVIASWETGTGTTRPRRLTFTDGTRTHDSRFQTIHERAQTQCLGRTREFNFVDPDRYNIAAYELAKRIGFGHMIPVTVERVWRGK